MPTLRIALAQHDYTVGDLRANADIVLSEARRAADAGADLVAFPELTLAGYPPEDLVLRASFRQSSQQMLKSLAGELAAAGLGEIAVVCGYVGDDSEEGAASGGARNSSAFLYGGEVVATYDKHHLPNYGVFDERRYFVPGDRFVIVRHLGVDIALTICEDLWQDGGPFAVAGEANVGLVININGSPYERNKDDQRLPLLQRRALEARAPIVYVNTVGGQDELVFDGDSMVVDADGTLLLRAPQFTEGLYCLDLDLDLDLPAATAVSTEPTLGMRIQRASTDVLGGVPREREPSVPVVATRLIDEAEVWSALVLGLRDYVRKNGFGSVVIALSGGIDSAVVAAIAADAIGGENVYGVSMPYIYSSEHSKSDAVDLADRIGAHIRTVPIEPMVSAYVKELDLTGLSEENVQARVRGTTIMAISNSEGHLVLATGNKSELAVGYTTIYDAGSIGGFSPLKDVPKTLVWRLARWRNDDAVERGETPPIPENSITKPPSAELRPGQLDSDSLPDYELLDAIIERYVDHDEEVNAIVASGLPEADVRRVAGLVNRAEWKRRQYPPGSKISLKAFGRDRRLPITSRWQEPAPPE
jgi:NAD+ synthase (glutamine-hydrolysing)